MAEPFLELAIGPINGINTVYETSRPYLPGTTAVWVNGDLHVQANEDGWIETSPQDGVFSMKEAPEVDDVIQIFFLDDTPSATPGIVMLLEGSIRKSIALKGKVSGVGIAPCSDPTEEYWNMPIGILTPTRAIAMIRGTSLVIELTVTSDDDCTPVDLTGATLIFTVKKCEGDIFPVIQKKSSDPLEIEVVDAPAGKALIIINPIDTAHLDIQPYVFDIWVILADGRRCVVIPSSPFSLRHAVTMLTVP